MLCTLYRNQIYWRIDGRQSLRGPSVCSTSDKVNIPNRQLKQIWKPWMKDFQVFFYCKVTTSSSVRYCYVIKWNFLVILKDTHLPFFYHLIAKDSPELMKSLNEWYEVKVLCLKVKLGGLLKSVVSQRERFPCSTS